MLSARQAKFFTQVQFISWPLISAWYLQVTGQNKTIQMSGDYGRWKPQLFVLWIDCCQHWWTLKETRTIILFTNPFFHWIKNQLQRFSELHGNLKVSSHQMLTLELTGWKPHLPNHCSSYSNISTCKHHNIRPVMLLAGIVMHYLKCSFRPVSSTSQNLMWRDPAIFTKFWKPLYNQHFILCHLVTSIIVF